MLERVTAVTAVMWFRRDLRLNDNQALAKACTYEGPLILLFHVQPEQFIAESYNHQAFFSSVRQFQKRVNKEHHLQVLYGDLKEAFLRLKQEVPDWDQIYFNQDDTGVGALRDQHVLPLLEELGIRVERYNDHYLHGAYEIKNKSGEAYKVYTPYYHQWLQLPKPTPAKVEWSACTSAVGESLFPEDEQRLAEVYTALPEGQLYPHGEEAALEQLNGFLETEVSAYHNKRDLPYSDSTSHLSTYLRTGELSIRTIWEKLQAQPDTQGKQTFIKELCWREFYNMIYAQHPHQKEEALQQQFRCVEWENDQQVFAKWQLGQTGYPLVDAAMRQLREHGWMHNRLRMIVASFLTKDLLIDWRWGEKYFQKMLIDYDPASNIGGWQWAASTGTDAVPYFRIFNPVTQSKRFDPEGDFIRKYVPELRKVPAALIHEPAKMTKEQQAACGVHVGEDYPLPVVDHQEARKRTLFRYEASKERAAEARL